MTQGYLGMDAGTQGLSVIFTDTELKIVATGTAEYEMVAGLAEGCYEQAPHDWTKAMATAVHQMRGQLAGEAWEVLAIGISGQMHGEVIADAEGQVCRSARLWCDRRNEAEGHELTELFAVKMPKRITAARWLWTCRQAPQLAARAAHLTTPAGWLSHQLTGGWTLGIGDAAGMFPIDQGTLDYDPELLAKFDQLVGHADIGRLGDLLPTVRRAGQDGGTLSAAGAKLLGLPPGIPVAPAEGDQPAALAGSLIGDAGMVSMSYGTSVTANAVGDRPFQGVDQAVDHFCAPDGKPINMVCLRNGTTFMNAIVGMYGRCEGVSDSFAAIIPQLLAAEADCGGVLALPFMDDEPALGVPVGGTGLLVGLNAGNATPGNTAKAALLATIFNLKLGSGSLDRQGYPRHEIVLSGGLTKSPPLAQLIADVFATPVTILSSAEEGTAWGAALLAKYRHAVLSGCSDEWSTFLHPSATDDRMSFSPNPGQVDCYADVFARYQRLLQLNGTLGERLAGDRARFVIRRNEPPVSLSSCSVASATAFPSARA